MSILEARQRPVSANGAAGTLAGRVTQKRVDAPATVFSRRVDFTTCDVDAYARVIEDKAIALLQSSSYRPVRRVSCEVRRQVLILRGRVPSFYMKQMAQTIVRELLSEGIAINNEVEVEWK